MIGRDATIPLVSTRACMEARSITFRSFRSRDRLPSLLIYFFLISSCLLDFLGVSTANEPSSQRLGGCLPYKYCTSGSSQLVKSRTGDLETEKSLVTFSGCARGSLHAHVCKRRVLQSLAIDHTYH